MAVTRLWVCGFCRNGNPSCPYRATKSGGFYIIVPTPLASGPLCGQGVADPEVREFDPKSALIAPEEGLADLRRILADAPKFLRAGGWVLCETGIEQHAALAELSAKLGYAESAGLPDMSGRPRFWKAKKA